MQFMQTSPWIYSCTVHPQPPIRIPIYSYYTHTHTHAYTNMHILGTTYGTDIGWRCIMCNTKTHVYTSRTYADGWHDESTCTWQRHRMAVHMCHANIHATQIHTQLARCMYMAKASDAAVYCLSDYLRTLPAIQVHQVPPPLLLLLPLLRFRPTVSIDMFTLKCPTTIALRCILLLPFVLSLAAFDLLFWAHENNDIPGVGARKGGRQVG